MYKKLHKIIKTTIYSLNARSFYHSLIQVVLMQNNQVNLVKFLGIKTLKVLKDLFNIHVPF